MTLAYVHSNGKSQMHTPFYRFNLLILAAGGPGQVVSLVLTIVKLVHNNHYKNVAALDSCQV